MIAIQCLNSLQKFPGNLLSSTFVNPDNIEEVRARTELERRGEYIELLVTEIGLLHPALIQLIKQCLHNAPNQRPSSDELLTRLQRMRVEVEGEHGRSLAKLDIMRARLQQSNKMKEGATEKVIY